MSFNKDDAARFGIHSIDHFCLDVPELDEARRFLQAFGLRVADRAGGIDVRARDGDHVWARIEQGPCKRLRYLSFNCYLEELAGLRAQAQVEGVQVRDEGEGFWFHDPDGNLLQIKPGPKTSPDGKSPNIARQVLPNVRGALGRAQRPRAAPTRLSHILMFTTDLDRSLAFYQRVLGLHLSDRSGDIVAFMHGRHGSDHHLVAFVRDAHKGWHHSAWDVPGIDDIGWGSEQMREAGFREGWGICQHTLGSNYFYYVRDPWGSFWEYSAHMDYVSAGACWASGDHPPEDALYMWGPEMPAYFIENVER